MPKPIPAVLLLIAGMFTGPYATAADWNVGLHRLEVTDPVAQRPVQAVLWYPTAAPEQQERLGPAVLSVAMDAEPASSARGLIVISHGFSGSFLSHNDTARALAGHGYWVLTPTHPDEPGLATGRPEFDPLIARPRHLRLLLDAVLNAEEYPAALPQRRVGIIGFSLGAYTALAALGGQPSLTGLDEYCAARPDDELLCSPGAEHRFGVLAPQLSFEGDERIRAAVLLAPAYGPLFTADGLAAISIPLLIFSAERDEALNNADHAGHIVGLLGDRAEHESLPKAGHFVFMAPCPDALKQSLAALCTDPEGVDRQAIHHTMNRRIIQFFDANLN